MKNKKILTASEMQKRSYKARIAGKTKEEQSAMFSEMSKKGVDKRWHKVNEIKGKTGV